MNLPNGLLNRKTVRVLILSCITLGFSGLLLRKVLLIEGSLLLIALIPVYHESIAVEGRGYARRSWLTTPAELFLLVSSLILALTSGEVGRPLLFFVLMGLFYLLMFIESTAKETPLPSFILKWLFGQAIFFGTFSTLYPGFVAVDSYRDLNIATFILKHAGGIPQPFTSLIWYNATPLAPLSYVSTSLVAGISLASSEAILGFIFVATAVLIVGAMTVLIFKDRRSGLMAIWLGGLIPYVWLWSTWPIPETLAILYSLSILLILFQRKKVLQLITVPLVVAVTFGHGGVAAELILILLTVVALSRDRALVNPLAILAISYTGYIVYASVSSTPSGLVATIRFLTALVTPQSTFVAPNITSSSVGTALIQAIETIAGYSWQVIIIAMGLIGFDKILRLQHSIRRNQLALLLIIAVDLLASVVFTLTGSTTDAVRYVSLVGYLASPIVIVVAVLHFLAAHRTARVVLATVIILFTVTSVANPQVAPDLWQGIGQTQFAVSQRLAFSTTIEELQSQWFVNAHDYSYPVVANYLPESVNLINGGYPASLYLGLGNFGMHGVDVHSTPIPPYIILLSYRALNSSFVLANHVANLTSRSSIVYSNPSASIELGK
jgi:hypothetical protein